MNVTTKRLDALKHPKKNVRIHSEQQIRELKRSLEKFGQTRAIVVDEDDTILIGNGLYEAMVSLGYQEATVYVKTGLSENDKKKLMIADNKTYALGSSRKRKEAEKGQEQKDYRQELIYLFNHMDVFFDTPHKRHVAERYRNFFMSVSAIATDADYKHIYEGLISGDPKMRAFRALYQRIYGRYISDAKKGERHG